MHNSRFDRFQQGPVIQSQTSPFDITDPPVEKQIVVRPDTAR
jgi:hypothetical protein